MQVKFILLYDGARLPERGHSIDVGLDVYTPKEGVLIPGPNVIPLGFSCEVPVGYNCSVYPRTGMVSGLKTVDFEVLTHGFKGKHATEENSKIFVRDSHNNGVSLFATHPPIDPGYAGEVNAIVLNHSDLYIKYPQHTRFGQLVFHPIAYAIPTLSVDTSRGAGAFGSTGI
jgi:dUTPase